MLSESEAESPLLAGHSQSPEPLDDDSGSERSMPYGHANGAEGDQARHAALAAGTTEVETPSSQHGSPWWRKLGLLPGSARSTGSQDAAQDRHGGISGTALDDQAGSDETSDAVFLSLVGEQPLEPLSHGSGDAAAARSAEEEEAAEDRTSAGVCAGAAAAICCRPKSAKHCALCALPSTVVAVLLAYLIAFFGVVPPVAQTIMDESTLVVSRMHMMRPTSRTITLNATVELHDIGQVSSTLRSTPVEVIHEGVVLAAMTLPELDIVGGQVLKFSMESVMDVLNSTAFTQATAKILQGQGGVWYIRGRPQIQVSLFGVSRTFHVDLYKEFLVPPTLLESVRGYDTKVTEPGVPDSFNISSKTSFFSSSILELYHLGLFVFDLEVLVDSQGRLMDDYSNLDFGRRVRIGSVIMEDFDLRQGINILDVTGQVLKTAENTAVLSQFVSNFMNGLDQPALIKGPTQSVSPFLDDVVTQALTFAGMTEQPIDASYIDKESFNGFSVRPPGFRHNVHYRGTRVVGRNPLGTAIAEHNITTQVLFSEPLGYRMNNKLLGKWTCPESRDMAELFSAPGMYRDDPARPPLVDMAPGERITFFMPGRPRKGQIKQRPCTLFGIPVAGDYDCCMVSVEAAAACRAVALNRTSFDVDITSEFILQLGEFYLPLTSRQKRTPTLFESVLTRGFLLDADLSCDDFDFF